MSNRLEKRAKVGFVGLGNAGWPIAANLPLNGFQVCVGDADHERTLKFVEKYQCQGFKMGQEDNMLADADVLITMLPNGDVVRSVIFGSIATPGLAKVLKKGCVIVDMSSADPCNSIKMAEELEEMGFNFVDSPITQRALHDTDVGRITLMIGAKDDHVVQKAFPVLNALAAYIFVMGPVGAGHAMKTMNNYIMASSICALCDSLVMGAKYGLDPERILDVLNVGTGRVFASENTMRDEGLTRRYQSGFQLSLLVKDLKINENLANTLEFDTPLPSIIRSRLSNALSEVEPGACHSKCLTAFEKWGNVELKQTDQPTTSAIPPDNTPTIRSSRKKN